MRVLSESPNRPRLPPSATRGPRWASGQRLGAPRLMLVAGLLAGVSQRFGRRSSAVEVHPDPAGYRSRLCREVGLEEPVDAKRDSPQIGISHRVVGWRVGAHAARDVRPDRSVGVTSAAIVHLVKDRGNGEGAVLLLD